MADPRPRSLLVHVFRVNEGLGNAVLLEFPDGSGAVVDWGTKHPDPLQFLLDHITRLRVVVATHDHADHTVGLVKLLQACHDRGIGVDAFVYPTGHLRERNPLTAAREKADELGIDMAWVGVKGSRTGPVVSSLAWDDDDGWELVVLAPTDIAAAHHEVKSTRDNRPAGNPTSAVVLFSFDKARGGSEGSGQALFPGDATERLLADAQRVAVANRLTLDNQLLVVPHHGGRHAMPGWLHGVAHGCVVVSGPTNSLKHPNVSTLRALVPHCCSGEAKRLFCTSYAGHCRERFATSALPNAAHLVTSGPCFGNLTIEVPLSGAAGLRASSAAGHDRRPYGWCGHPLPPTS